VPEDMSLVAVYYIKEEMDVGNTDKDVQSVE